MAVIIVIIRLRPDLIKLSAFCANCYSSVVGDDFIKKVYGFIYHQITNMPVEDCIQPSFLLQYEGELSRPILELWRTFPIGEILFKRKVLMSLAKGMVPFIPVTYLKNHHLSNRIH